MDRPYAFRTSDWLVVAATTLGLFITLSAIAIWLTWDDISRQFQRNQSAIQATLSQRLNSLDAALVSLIGNIHSYPHAPERVSSFAQSITEKFPYLQSAIITHQVAGENRPGYENAKRQSGFSQFTLKQWQNKTITSADAREYYYPVDLIEPTSPANVRLRGLDMRSLPALDSLIQACLQNAHINASQPLHFMGDREESYFIAKAIYRNDYVIDPQTARPQDIAGVAMLQIDSNRLLPELARFSHFRLQLRHDTDKRPILNLNNAYQTANWLPQISVTQTLQAHDQNWLYQIDYQISATDFLNRNLALASIIALLLSSGFTLAYRTIRLARLRHQHTRDQLFEQREKARVALESIEDAVVITNLHGRIDFINPAAAALLDLPADLLLGKNFAQSVTLISDDNADISIDPVQRCLQTASHRYQCDEDILLLHNGNQLALHTGATAIQDARGEISGVVLVLRDISHSQRLAKKMSWEASHDPLTGLLNRRGFEPALGSALDNYRTNGSAYVLCYLDLDEFKPVNDACGHQAGDELLKLITANIKTHIRRNDVLARLGGDEFGLLLTDCPLSHASEIAEKIREEVRNTQFYWNEQLFTVGVSIGMVMINDQMQGIADVINAADTACYMAKDNGRNQVCVLQPEDSTPDTGISQWPERIRKALANNQFMLLTQVIVPLTSGTAPPMLEFLIRLKTSAGRLASPKAFLPAAERYELMYDIDLWVINQAMQIIARHQQDSSPILYTINLSAQSLEHADLARVIEQAITRHNIKPQQLCFETTEAAVISQHEKAVQLIKHLRAIGCHFAIDNFGAGLSSLNHLKKLPIDFLKIDGSLIRNIRNDVVDKSLVRTISHVGHILNFRIVAEWVEDDTTLSMLNELGVDYAQGFHISRPDNEFEPATRVH